MTTNYSLNSYGFGAGGVANSTTSNYALEGIGGEVSGATATTATYNLKPGFNQTQQANVPKVTLTNPSNYYDKLKFVIDTQNNPTDALYALQISTSSNFSSGISYVKNDFTIGGTLALTDYQLYTTWGGGSGNNIIGLSPNTTYYLRVKATQGKYTESAYGPSSSAATVNPSISFCLYTNANCNAAGTTVSFGTIPVNTPASTTGNIKLDFATNADFGGKVYVYSNGGLHSNVGNYTLSSATADISVTSLGYGAQIASVSTSSGTLSKVSPFDLTGNNVGILSTSIGVILNSSAPVVGGTAAIQLQAKTNNTVPAATDYSDSVTLIAAASF